MRAEDFVLCASAPGGTDRATLPGLRSVRAEAESRAQRESRRRTFEFNLFGALGAAWLLLVPGCAGSTRTQQLPNARARSQPSELSYRFRVDAGLTRLAAELCVRGRPPASLIYGAEASAEFMRDPRLVAEAGERLQPARPLRVVQGQIQLAHVRDDACVAYEIDLAAAAASGKWLVAHSCARALLTSTELFLWRPPRRAAGLSARAQFELPDGIQLSVPWPERAGHYALDETAFTFTGHALFGSFSQRELALPSATMSVSTPGDFSEGQLALIARWLESAGRMVSLVSGRFPISRAQVIVLPTTAAQFSFRFGHTGRSGGASILLFVPSEIAAEDLSDDWIAVHEFSHLLHPFVRREDAWLSEGLATYLQEVLRVRAGTLRADAAWRRLYTGAALGRRTRAGLRAESERMRYARNYQRVYWAGAAVALMADVELRRRSDGHKSLDTALAALSESADFMRTPASAGSLLAALDEASGGRAFQDSAQRYLSGEELPDLTELYVQLGLIDAAQPAGAEIALRAHADAPLAWIREAIMARRE